MHAQTIIIDTPAKRERVLAWLAKIPIDEVLELTLRAYKPTRSEMQNRRYWLLLEKAAEHTGHDKNELHEAFKARFLGMQETEIAGEIVTHQRSSAKLKTKEFAEYMERVEQWIVETLGIWLE